VLPFVGVPPAGARAAGPELIASAEPGWPQFRGPRRDGVSDERGLLPEWPEGGPGVLWSTTGVGRGYSSPVIAGGRWFITGDFNDETRVLAFDLAGKPLWSARNGAAWLNQYPGARASVACSAGKVYHQNSHGRVVCLDAATGREEWAVELLQAFGGENITWGLSECLVVDEHHVYATAGGREALVVALEKSTGKVQWKSAPLLDREAGDRVEHPGYGPPILVRFAGRRLIIGTSERHLYCVDADTGVLQWTRRRPTNYAVLATMPTLVGEGVFMAAPYGPPATVHRLIPPAPGAGRVGVEDGWTANLDTCQGGVVHAAGRVFGSYYRSAKGWVALDAGTGTILYTAPEFAKGSALHADGRLYVLCEDGWVLLVDSAAPRFEIKGRFRLPNVRGRDAWAHPVLLDGRLYLRYHDTVTCHDVRARP
jgi:outer membrane protein assembly factor BamB